MSPRKSSKKKQDEFSFHGRFRKPTESGVYKALKLNAIKKKNNQQLIQKLSLQDELFEKLIKHFPKLPQPQNEMDWLVTYHELEQSCQQFFKETPAIEESNIKFIYYIRMGDFTQTNLKFADLFDYAKAFFGENSIKELSDHIQIDIDSSKRLVKAKYRDILTYNLKARFHNDKFQIQAQSFHKLLKRIMPNDAMCLIAFTDHDLYIEDGDLFVAGLCDGALRVGGFSCFRYNPALSFSETNWFQSKHKKLSASLDNILLTRSSKLLVHETCHLLGIDHCVYFDCCMNGSGHLEEDFRQSMFLCPIDLKKLWMIFGFDIMQRYSAMLRFFEKHKCHREIVSLKQIIASIES
jgi:archaemetzincin